MRSGGPRCSSRCMRYSAELSGTGNRFGGHTPRWTEGRGEWMQHKAGRRSTRPPAGSWYAGPQMISASGKGMRTEALCRHVVFAANEGF